MTIDIDRSQPLTPRQRQVIQAVVDGLSNKAIAKRFGFSFATAKFHVDCACQKLGDAGRVVAAVTALKRGLAIFPEDKP